MNQTLERPAVGPAVNERRAVNSKEACYLLRAGADALRTLDAELDAAEIAEIVANGIVRLSIEAVERILGDAWEAKLDTNPHAGHNRLILAESYTHDGDHFVYIDAAGLEEISLATVTQNEASRMLERRFGCIEKVQRFVADRPARDFQFSETFMSGFLGDRWRDRLKRSAVPFEERQLYGEVNVFVPFAPFYAVAERALRGVAARRAR
ncbi:MAG: hypothetical protein U0746_22860 [Gemmataceae bacterium]